jgi:glutaredoxin
MIHTLEFGSEQREKYMAQKTESRKVPLLKITLKVNTRQGSFVHD